MPACLSALKVLPVELLYSHSQVWTRRPPYYASPSFRHHERLDVVHREPLLRYLPVPCENLLVEGGKVVKVTCQRGVNCPFSHSPEEIAYHPLVYKIAFSPVAICLVISSPRPLDLCVCCISSGMLRGRFFSCSLCGFFCLSFLSSVFYSFLLFYLLSAAAVPVNYPGATLVELLPNKNGRRRRQRSASSAAASVLGGSSSSTSSKAAAALRSTTAGGSQSSELLSQLVLRLTDRAERSGDGHACAGEGSLCWPLEDGLGAGDSAAGQQKSCEDTAASEQQPLANLLRLFDSQLDLQRCPIEASGSTPRGGDRNSQKKSSKLAARREAEAAAAQLLGCHTLQQQQEEQEQQQQQQQQQLMDVLGEDLPLRKPADYLAAAAEQAAPYVHASEHLDVGEGLFSRYSFGLGSRGGAALGAPEGEGLVCPRGSTTLDFLPLAPGRPSGNSHLNLFAGFDNFMVKSSAQPCDPFEEFGLQQTYHAGGGAAVWGAEGDPLSAAETEPCEVLPAPWSNSSSQGSSFSESVSCSSWTAWPSQGASFTPKASLSELDHLTFDEVKSAAAAVFQGDRLAARRCAGSGRCGDRRGGSLASGCFPLEGLAGAGRSSCRCMQRDIRCSPFLQGLSDELPLICEREGGCCQEQWLERSSSLWAGSPRAPFLLGHPEDAEAAEGALSAGGPSLVEGPLCCPQGHRGSSTAGLCGQLAADVLLRVAAEAGEREAGARSRGLPGPGAPARQL
ncbi:hypothetical protein Efla_002295 [Eimeria flavescens]